MEGVARIRVAWALHRKRVPVSEIAAEVGRHRAPQRVWPHTVQGGRPDPRPAARRCLSRLLSHPAASSGPGYANTSPIRHGVAFALKHCDILCHLI
jgi:hypothetical protein